MGLLTRQELLDSFEYAIKVSDFNTLFAIHKVFELFPHFDSLVFGEEYINTYVTREPVYVGDTLEGLPMYEESAHYQVFMIFDAYNPTVSNIGSTDVLAIVQDKIVNLVRNTKIIDFLATIPTYILTRKIKEKEEELELLKQQLK